MAGNWNAGSFADRVLLFNTDLPTSLSGVPTQEIAERKAQFVSDQVGETIDINSVPLKYQGIILNLTLSETFQITSISETTSSDVSLGELKISSATSSDDATSVSAKRYYEMAMAELNNLGYNVRFSKVNG